MAKSKYQLMDKPLPQFIPQVTELLMKDGEVIAAFCGKNARTNAQKVCDLLNETSRSQGVYPK